MADAPRDLMHQLRAVDGAFEQLTPGRDLEERIFDPIVLPRRSRVPLALAAATGTCALVAALWIGASGPDAPSATANAAVPAPAPQQVQQPQVAAELPVPAPTEKTAGPPRQLARGPDTRGLNTLQGPDPLPQLPVPGPARGMTRGDHAIASPDGHARTEAQPSAVSVVSDGEVTAALARLGELRAAGAHVAVIALADALLAKGLDARERETCSFERVRALVRLERPEACAALTDHVRAHPASAADVAPLRARAKCP